MRLRPPRVYLRGRETVGSGDGTEDADGAAVPSIPAARDGSEPRRGEARRAAGGADGTLATRFGLHAWGMAHAVALVVAVVGLLAVVAVLVAQNTSLLGVRSVQVHGADDVPRAAVLAAADLPPGTPMTSVDSESVEARVGEIPGVESVTVERRWPTSVRITVSERVPILALSSPQGLVLVDRNGVAFEEAVAAPENLVLLQASGDDAVVAAAAALATLPRGLRAQVDRATAASARDVRLFFTDGREVVWGDGKRNALKMTVLRSLLRVEGTVYDVSEPEVAVVR